MENFWSGFEKIAVSLGWTMKRTLGGLASRTKDPSLIASSKKAIKGLDGDLLSKIPAKKLTTGKTRYMRKNMNRLTKNNPAAAKSELRKALYGDKD